MRVYVLILNANTDCEGLHSVRQGGVDTVLMFEQEDDATRYSLLLEAQDFPGLSVEAINDEEIIEFCEGAGLQYRRVTAQDFEMPPQANIEPDKWQIEEQKRSQAEDSEASQSAEADLSDAEVDSNPELDRLRQQLEKLL